MNDCCDLCAYLNNEGDHDNKVLSDNDNTNKLRLNQNSQIQTIGFIFVLKMTINVLLYVMIADDVCKAHCTCKTKILWSKCA